MPVLLTALSALAACGGETEGVELPPITSGTPDDIFPDTQAEAVEFVPAGELGMVAGETATLRVHGEIRDFFFTDRGHFVLTQGEGGLSGVHASGTFVYTIGFGGPYAGLAHFDDRP